MVKKLFIIDKNVVVYYDVLHHGTNITQKYARALAIIGFLQ